jgi:hypothetical protein
MKKNDPIFRDHNFWVAVGISIAPREMGRRGGLKGGRIRAERLSPERRSEIARLAARARWGKPEGGRG